MLITGSEASKPDGHKNVPTTLPSWMDIWSDNGYWVRTSGDLLRVGQRRVLGEARPRVGPPLSRTRSRALRAVCAPSLLSILVPKP